jgi:hypothetical protein
MEKVVPKEVPLNNVLLDTSKWTLVFINAQYVPASGTKLKFETKGFFDTKEEAEKAAKKCYGMRMIAPVIRGNEDDPLRGARFYLG